MVTVVFQCAHRDCMTLGRLNKAFRTSVKCQEDGYSSRSAEVRSYEFPEDCIGLKIRSLPYVKAAWEQ